MIRSEALRCHWFLPSEVDMALKPQALGICWFVVSLGLAPPARAQESWQTMRPVIRGRQAAITSMKAEATEAARRILAEGGNAFDAVVAGQAALAVTDFPLNGVGSDAEILIYVARENRVVSINANRALPGLPPSIGMRRTMAAPSPTATACFREESPAWLMRGTSCWTAGAP